MTDMTPEHALQKLLAAAEGNPFCPVGHLVEHGLGGADALRAALSRPADTEASRTLDALIALASGDDGLPDDLRTGAERLRTWVEGLEADAARYRWLRKGSNDDVAVVRGLSAMDYGMSAVVSTYSEEIDGDDLDAAIDAAMSKEGK